MHVMTGSNRTRAARVSLASHDKQAASARQLRQDSPGARIAASAEQEATTPHEPRQRADRRPGQTRRQRRQDAAGGPIAARGDRKPPDAPGSRRKPPGVAGRAQSGSAARAVPAPRQLIRCRTG